MQKFDLTFVSGARPDLMQKTLQSFAENLFSNIIIENAFFNIDPVFGSDDEVTKCKDLALKYFPNAEIRTPKNPSFGAAVKYLWLSTTDNHVLHLEDDWELNFPFFETDITSKFDEDVGMVQLGNV